MAQYPCTIQHIEQYIPYWCSDVGNPVHVTPPEDAKSYLLQRAPVDSTEAVRTMSVPERMRYKFPVPGGGGRLFVFSHRPPGRLLNPVLMMWGFDTGAGKRSQEYVETMLAGLIPPDPYNAIPEQEPWLAERTGGLLNLLLKRGYDVCVLLPDNATNLLQNSSMLLLSALEYVLDCSPSNTRVPVVGFSAGGIIARWALRYLQEHPDYFKYPINAVSAYVSFDTPHRGANVPLSIQYFLGYLAQKINAVADLLEPGAAPMDGIEGLVAIRSPAARQLACYHYGNAAPEGKQHPGPHPLRTQLLAELGDYWPAGIPRHAYANGCPDGVPFDTAMPGDVILAYMGQDGMSFRAMPKNWEGCDVFTIGPPWPRTTYNWVEPGAQPLDSAAGSRTSFYHQVVNGLNFLGYNDWLPAVVRAVITTLSALPHPAPSCFVPTTSALNLSDDVWGVAPDTPNPPHVPFDSWHSAPRGHHERHVQITDAAAEYVASCLPAPVPEVVASSDPVMVCAMPMPAAMPEVRRIE